MEDCFFYYNSHCTKGPACRFRHCAAALATQTVCRFWLRGTCFRQNCSFRHTGRRMALPGGKRMPRNVGFESFRRKRLAEIKKMKGENREDDASAFTFTANREKEAVTGRTFKKSLKRVSSRDRENVKVLKCSALHKTAKSIRPCTSDSPSKKAEFEDIPMPGEVGSELDVCTAENDASCDGETAKHLFAEREQMLQS